MKSALIIVALIFSGLAFAAPKIGTAAPAFELQGHNGKTYKLADLKGKYVILEWFNNECPYVDKHYATNNMQKLQKKYNGKKMMSKMAKEVKKKTGKEVVWLSIVSSAKGKQGYVTPETAKAIIKDRKAHMAAVLMDADGAVGKMYDAKTTPHMFVINPEGNIAYMGAIDNEPSANPASVKKADNYVVRAMASLADGKAVSPATTKPYGCSVKY